MSLTPHRLSSCCQVPILGNENTTRGICGNCKQPCGIEVVDDGERAYKLKMEQVKRHSINEVTKRVIVTGYNCLEEKITVEFKDRRGDRGYCTINNTDFFKWASANSYVALLPEVEYVGGESWNKQPHLINQQLNANELERFYRSMDKPMLENYLNEKIILKSSEK